MDLESLTIPHHFVQNSKQMVEAKTIEIAEMMRIAMEKLTELRLEQNEKKNKTRISKDFVEGDYVFVLDSTVVPGAARPLKTRLNPYPFVVLRQYLRTVLLKRLSDGYTTMYHKDHIKKYDKSSPLFNTLPKEVQKVLLYKFSDLIEADLLKLIVHDSLQVPEGIQLFEENDSHDFHEPLVTDSSIPVPGPSGKQKRSNDNSDAKNDDENEDDANENDISDSNIAQNFSD
jgi:hypothetical protein